jgi:hypothetical protein
LDACQSGLIYEEFADEVGLAYGADNKAERSHVKRSLLVLMMGNPSEWSEVTKDRWEGLRRRWPTIAATLDQLKAKDHRGAARTLQRAESRLVVDGVGRWMLEHRPDVPCLMIHDAVMTPGRHEDVVRDAICRSWAPWGVRPHLK